MDSMTLQQAIVHFSDYENCHKFMVELRWSTGKVTCPRCGSDHVVYLEKAKKWKCYAKHRQPTFTLKTGTVFEDSPISLDKWVTAVWQVVNCRNGVSSFEIHRALGVTQKTAWFMLHRIRLAMQDDLKGGMTGEVEVDESWIGGKARNMHKNRKEALRSKITGKVENKTMVLGIVERATKNKAKRVRATVIPDRSKSTMQAEVAGVVDRRAFVYSDEWGDIWRMDDRFIHGMVNHAEQYVDGYIHTNGVENFWSLLKRGLAGTYVSIEPFHLFRYIDEQAFRFNNRKHADGSNISDFERFKSALSQIVGKRLTYAQLTGKEAPPSEEEAF